MNTSFLRLLCPIVSFCFDPADQGTSHSASKNFGSSKRSTMNESDIEKPSLCEDGSIYVGTTTASLCFFLFFYPFMSPRISSLLCSKYSRLPLATRINWNTRVGSSLHAVIVSIISLYCFFFDDKTSSSPVMSGAVLARLGVAITMGYMLADFLIIVASYKYIGDLFTLVHHLLAMAAYYFVVVYGVLPYFANIRQLAEISTPFVNQRWYFDAIGHARSSRSFVVNGYIMGMSFFLCRIAIMPMYYFKCYSVWGTQEQINLGLVVNVYWIFTCVVLDAINLYWFRKIVKGAIKLTRALKDKRQN